MCFSRAHDPDARSFQAINIWIIQFIVAIGPPIGALAFNIYIKTDWGIPLFFLVPLAVVAIPQLSVRRSALVGLVVAWLVMALAVLAAAPVAIPLTMPRNAMGQFTYGSQSQLARQLTELWHQRFHSRWKVVAGATDVGAPVTFYSPDHPALLAPDEAWPLRSRRLEPAAV